MTKTSTRGLALDVLMRVEDDEAFLKTTLDGLCIDRGLPAIERALASELSYGVVRWRAWLDHALAPHVRRGIESVAPRVLMVLRLGAYQLLRMRVADHAAVNETVELARAVGREPAARFVNAVLRALQRAGSEPPPPPDAARDPAGHLAVKESFPRWLVERAIAELGVDEAAAALAAHNAPAPFTVRANARKLGRAALMERLASDGVRATETQFAPHGLILDGLSDVGAAPSFREGLYTVQDEASQLVALLCAPAENARVLDLCAAPGGKATALAEAAHAGRVDAVDRGSKRVSQIAEAGRRLGHTNLMAHVGDASATLPFAGADGEYDVVLLDAPCSGLGVLRRHPEAKWRVRDIDVVRLAAEQARLLASAAKWVRRGGSLVYSVCTTTPEETGGVLEGFLESEAGSAFEVAPAQARGDVLAKVCDDRGLLRLWPHRHGTDGFFAAAFRRKE